MRYLTLNIDKSNSIEIHNSFLGNETIFHNGKEVSKKWSLLGDKHEFSVIESGEKTKYRVEIGLRFATGVSCNIYRNDEAILLF